MSGEIVPTASTLARDVPAARMSRRTIPKDPTLKERLLKIVQQESSNSNKTDEENKRYLLSILASPPASVIPVTPLDCWLEQHGFDFCKSRMALTGRAEDEPETDFPGLYAAGWSGAMVEPAQSIEMLAKPEHSIVIGEDGHGKTMLRRMLQRKSDPALKCVCVQWKKWVELMEEHQAPTVARVITSLLEDVISTVEQDSRWREKIPRFERAEVSWRQSLAHLKGGLKLGGAESVFVGLDNLDHYPETRDHPDRARDLLTALLRPDVLQDNQPWYVKLFVSPRLYEQMHGALQHSIAFHVVPIKWDREGLRTVLQERIRYLRKESQSLAEPALQEIADPQIENLLLEKARSPRDVVRLLRDLMSHRAARWDQAGRKGEDLDITLADWRELQGK